MDKVFFCGEGIQLQSFGRFGADVVLDNKKQADQPLAFGFEKPWITDHLGVRVIFNLAGDYRLWGPSRGSDCLVVLVGILAYSSY